MENTMELEKNVDANGLTSIVINGITIGTFNHTNGKLRIWTDRVNIEHDTEINREIITLK